MKIDILASYQEFEIIDNTLIISEKDQMAYLPYHLKETVNAFNEKLEHTINYEDYTEELYKNELRKYILSLYSVPLKNFSNSTIARFRESYNFVKNELHGTNSQAINLATELMLKHELNPIIITACRTMDELDIYINCLETDELYDFDCFNIKYLVSPNVKSTSYSFLNTFSKLFEKDTIIDTPDFDSDDK